LCSFFASSLGAEIAEGAAKIEAIRRAVAVAD